MTNAVRCPRLDPEAEKNTLVEKLVKAPESL